MEKMKAKRNAEVEKIAGIFFSNIYDINLLFSNWKGDFGRWIKPNLLIAGLLFLVCIFIYQN